MGDVMPKGKINKTAINKSVFMAVVKQRKSSINKLGQSSSVECTERTIRRSLEEGFMTPRILDDIAKHLDVDSRLLSGELHKRAERYKDPFLKEIYLAQLTPEDYPYYSKRRDELNKRPIEDLIEQILSLFEISISQFEDMDFEEQYSLQHDIFEVLIPVMRKHFAVDAFGKKDMPNLEKILCDLESYRDDHYLYEHANTVLRKRFLENPPRGVTKAEILKMSPEDLIAMDMYHDKSV